MFCRCLIYFSSRNVIEIFFLLSSYFNVNERHLSLLIVKSILVLCVSVKLLLLWVPFWWLRKVHSKKLSNQNRSFKTIGLDKDSLNSTKPCLFEIIFRKYQNFLYYLVHLKIGLSMNTKQHRNVICDKKLEVCLRMKEKLKLILLIYER